MKVFLVTHGEYSDYSVDSVWDDEETAKKVCKYKGGKYDEYRVEPFDLNTKNEAEVFLFHFHFDESGNEISAYGTGKAELKGEEEIRESEYTGKKILSVFVNSENKELAFKKACDKRAQYVAQKETI